MYMSPYNPQGHLRILELASIPELGGCKLAEHSLEKARQSVYRRWRLKGGPKTPKGNPAKKAKRSSATFQSQVSRGHPHLQEEAFCLCGSACCHALEGRVLARIDLHISKTGEVRGLCCGKTGRAPA